MHIQMYNISRHLKYNKDYCSYVEDLNKYIEQQQQISTINVYNNNNDNNNTNNTNLNEIQLHAIELQHGFNNTSSKPIPKPI